MRVANAIDNTSTQQWAGGGLQFLDFASRPISFRYFAPTTLTSVVNRKGLRK